MPFSEYLPRQYYKAILMYIKKQAEEIIPRYTQSF